MAFHIEITLDTTIQKLLDYGKELTVNREYQRGLAWNPRQKQMFIDSLFRGYKSPAFYFHRYQSVTGNTYRDIIDGQQRIDAITSYHKDQFALQKNESSLPNFVQGEEECEWAGCNFKSLSEKLQQQFLGEKVVVYEITTDDDNQIRDLFIRLQRGTPLGPQDIRDAWPGEFPTFVKVAGGQGNRRKKSDSKVSNASDSTLPGWKFFNKTVVGSKGSNKRKLVAQSFMLYWNKVNNKGFVEVSSKSVDEFYRQQAQVGFSADSKDAKNFENICDTIHREFEDHNHSPIIGHHMLHLILLVSDLQNDFVSGSGSGSWEGKLGDALKTFKDRCKEGKQANKEGNQDEYYSNYTYWTELQSDTVNAIQTRHLFFYEKMIELLRAVRKDQVRIFSESDREHIFYRDGRKCQYHEMKRDSDSKLKPMMVPWEYAEIHHVTPHSKGGATILANGALVHKDNHPKNTQDVETFKKWWKNKKQYSYQQSDNKRGQRRSLSRELPPDGTQLKTKHKSVEYHGVIRDRKVELSGEVRGVFENLSKAGDSITNYGSSGWKFWQICLPGTHKWILADEWRKRNSK